MDEQLDRPIGRNIHQDILNQNWKSTMEPSRGAVENGSSDAGIVPVLIILHVGSGSGHCRDLVRFGKSSFGWRLLQLQLLGLRCSTFVPLMSFLQKVTD